MSDIAKAFGRGKAFIGFLTGGDPSVEDSERFARAMIGGGADLVEIGIPFSDPIAEGEVIQRANARALAAGATLDKLFAMARRVSADTGVPLVFLTYLNPVYRRGYEKFFAQCRENGVSGVIIPDLPFEERGEAEPAADANGVDIISLVSPTSERRVLDIAKAAKGFLYVVSSMGVTGVRGAITTDIAAITKLAKSVSGTPAAVGFGIGTPEQAREMAGLADGVIVGSAIVKIVERYGAEAAEHVRAFTEQMKAAVRDNR